MPVIAIPSAALLLCAALCGAHGATGGQQQALRNAVTVSSSGAVEPHSVGKPKQAPGVKLAVKHMSKMGGSFLINLLNEMTTDAVNFPRDPGRKFYPKYFEEYPSPRNQYERQRRHYFTIAGVRNPCDWYVSQWAFASKFDNSSMRSKFGRDFFGDLHDTTKFADWMQWAMGAPSNISIQEWMQKASSEARPGVLTVRFWESFVGHRTDYTPPKKSPAGMYATTLLDSYSGAYAGRSDVVEAIGSFRPLEKADCWVRQENYKEDLKACLTVYETLSGARLDWVPFERNFGEAQERKVLPDAPLRADLPKNISNLQWSSAASSQPSVSRNPSKHDSCESYYTPELADAVYKVDRGLFDAFGYPACCQPAARQVLISVK